MIQVMCAHLEEEDERYLHQPPMHWNVCRGVGNSAVSNDFCGDINPNSINF